MAGVITLLDQPRTLDALGRATDALIYFYLTGTTILAPIYNDAALADPAPNPVELAAGEIFPDIYLDPAVTYRRRILYGDGTIHDVDPLPAAGAGSSADVSFQQAGSFATVRSVEDKLREDPISLLDYVLVEDALDITTGLISANSAFTTLFNNAVAMGAPARVTKGSYKITAQLSLPANLTLILEDGVDIFFEDNTLESALYINADDVTVIGRGAATISGPLTTSAGRTGICLLVRGTTGVTLTGVKTSGGKYGIMSLDNTDLVANESVVSNSFLWGWLFAGTRNSRVFDCGVEGTRGTGSAADGFKITGYYHPSGVDWSTRSSYNLFFTDCWANDTAAGQTFDIISANDAVDDLYNIFIDNPQGRNNFTGLLEMKCDETGGAFTNYPIHDIYVRGGFYSGNGLETNGIYISDRIYNVVIDGTVIRDCDIGIAVGNPARYLLLKNITIVRPRKEGLLWASNAGGGVACVVDNLTVINPNWGQGASTYSGIRIQNATQLRLINPVVRRSQENSGSAHAYGISIEASATNTVIDGIPTLLGHATGAVNDLGVTTRWPVTLSTAIDLNLNAAQFYKAISQLRGAFYVCRIGIVYDEASNVARNIQVQARNSGSANIGAALATSAAAALFDVATQAVNPPTRANLTQLVAQVQPVVLPGSPTGKIVLSLFGFWDGGSVS